MDRLTKMKQQKLQRLSNEQITRKLLKRSIDEASVRLMSRSQLLETWATILADSADSPCSVAAEGAVSKDAEGGLTLYERKQLEMEYRLREAEIGRQREKDEREYKLKEAEMARQRERDEAEMARQRERDEAEFRLKSQELEIRRLEVEGMNNRKVANDASEDNNTIKLMQQTRFFAESLKHLIGTCPLEPRDIPAFFEHVEKIFRNYHVDGEIKANLLIMSLNEKAKTWLHTISADGLKDYSEIKRLILQEFRLNPTKLRDEFFALRRQKSESYTSFGAKLYGTLNHYFQSRNITGLEDAMKLICADRMKELLSRHTLEFILSQEQAASWMSPDVLAQTIDKYETAMNMKVSSDNTCMPESINQIQSFRENEHQMYRSSNNKSASPKQTCFSCGKIGHIAKHCTWKNRITPTATRNVMRCETDKKTQRPVEIESPIRTKEEVDKPDLEETGSRDSAVAEKSTLLEEQLACESLKRRWRYVYIVTY
ncbi:hypothetical protein HELRODRAFT_183621 [Helobdella robusta]|uniref:CCHC-type domain-containing protein n=1 Tax=Helobdella robusta TaxID=6412 RepID=T1FJY2_HELRO|nr:hypothetical protein HELRODRAFT_183621 [Helobdella robusta]ESO10464.1 hypothetical protein HELRODRAFT_183621 [Helobdella robusta]